MYFVDTDIVPEARGLHRKRVSWLRPAESVSLYPGALTPGEIIRGIAVKQKSDTRIANYLAGWLRTLFHDHGKSILPVTDDRCGMRTPPSHQTTRRY